MLTAATLALSASPASASGTHSGRAYVFGAAVFDDDWGDEGDLSTGTHTSSNATCLWQKILWADGYLASSDIDGIFGGDTKTATQAWQNYWSLPSDGVVGKNTFARAGLFLWDGDKNDAVDTYIGQRYKINISRDSEGRYNFYDGDGIKRLAGYDYRTCS
jgi:hypothetical protein